jgi:polysaccharide biosynthesis protein PslG
MSGGLDSRRPERIAHGRSTGLVRARAGRLLLVIALAAVLATAAAQPALGAGGGSVASRPKQIGGAALHPWRLQTQDYPAYWPLRDPAIRERTFASLEAAGIRRARVDLKWSVVEPESHNRILRDWSDFDATVASARKHHVSLLPMVAFTPSWASRHRHPWAFPDRAEHFEDFMLAAFQRYPEIRAWEIWNEPNLSLFARPRPDAARFVSLLRAAHRARARAGSRAKLISGGLAFFAHLDAFRFFDQMARLHAFDYVDGFGIHPYSPEAPDHPWSSFLKLSRFRERLVRLGRPNVTLWATEYGYPTASVGSGYGPAGGERAQATRLRKAFALAAGWPWLENLTWYGLRDDCSNAANPDCRFGLVRENFGRKLAFRAMQEVLAGRLPKLSSSTRLRVKRIRTAKRTRAAKRGRARNRRRRRRRSRRPRQVRFELSGSVFTPGSDPSGRAVTVRLRRARRAGGRYRRSREISLPIRAGRYRTSLKLGRGYWRVVALLSGTARHDASSSRVVALRVRG